MGYLMDLLNEKHLRSTSNSGPQIVLFPSQSDSRVAVLTARFCRGYKAVRAGSLHGGKEKRGQAAAAATIMQTRCRCDKVTTSKHQSRLNLTDHLSEAHCAWLPSQFGAHRTYDGHRELHALPDPSAVTVLFSEND